MNKIKEIIIPDVHSLKDKRNILRALLSRIRKVYSLSAAETGLQDKWQRAILGFSAVNSDPKLLDRIVNGIKGILEEDPRFELVDYSYFVERFECQEAEEFRN